MGTEIERKFLVRTDAWQPRSEGTCFKQGYLVSETGRTVRVRVAGDRGSLTIKGPTRGVTRPEFEYAIPVEDAHTLLDELCDHPILEKHRHEEIHAGKKWEIDVFHGENEGLVVAEIELSREDETFELPVWAGQEVSFDHRYFNASLQKNPYKTWTPC